MQPDGIRRALMENNGALLNELTASDEAADRKRTTGRKASSALAECSNSSWPNPLRPAAFHGPAGELVRLIEPHSEADPAAILIQFLVAFGNLIYRSAHFVAEGDRHYTSLYAVVVGQTSKGRKGTSWGQVRRMLGALDPDWAGNRIMNGLASGEGLITAIGKDDAPDRRLLAVETEFARVLQVCERDGCTLSAVIREAWDTGTLRTMTKKDPLHATDAHISIIGHITRDELRRLLTDTAAANGFANRFLWVCAQRSKQLPDGGALNTGDLDPIGERLRSAADFAKLAGELRRDEAARAIWHGVYGSLSEGQPGLFGAVTSRAEAQVMRLACVYAVLDCSRAIRAEHLLAALAIWQYCEASARFIFGAAFGDATADEIIQALRQRPEGMTRTEIREHFSRNKRSAEIERALALLQEYGRARMLPESDGPGRPAERWHALNALNAGLPNNSV
jgi:hypothetical protein